jgi:hypothetical protein
MRKSKVVKRRVKRGGRKVDSAGDALGILDDEEDRKEQGHINFRCPAELIERLDRAAVATKKTRSKTIVRLLTYALDQWEREQSQSKPRR